MRERYSFGQAEAEAAEMKKMVDAGEAADYRSAELSIEASKEDLYEGRDDAKFAKLVADPEKFRDLFGRRTLVDRLEAIKHAADGKTIYEHTRQLLMNLRTDAFKDLDLGGINLPDLVRAVGLYHDADKLFDGQPKDPRDPDGPKYNFVEAKAKAVPLALQEVAEHMPKLFADERARELFKVLMSTGTYFGYNLERLSRLPEPRFNDEGEKMIDNMVHAPIGRLKEKGIKIDPDALFAVQFALSRADTSAIDVFKGNTGKLDRLYARLLELVS